MIITIEGIRKSLSELLERPEVNEDIKNGISETIELIDSLTSPQTSDNEASDENNQEAPDTP